MALSYPKKDVLNWFKFDVSFSLELIFGYVDDVEEQARESINRYHENCKTIEVQGYCEEDARLVDLYKGLDSESWDLETIFTEYFPSMQRRSALLTVVAFFEHEFDKLCLLYQTEKEFEVQLVDHKGKGIERAVSYLENIADIKVFRQSKEWNQIKKIQKIRNIISHQGGKLQDYKGNKSKAAADYINQIDSLYGEEQVGINEGFLKHVAEIFKSYFELISSSIEQAENV